MWRKDHTDLLLIDIHALDQGPDEHLAPPSRRRPDDPARVRRTRPDAPPPPAGRGAGPTRPADAPGALLTARRGP